MKKTMYLLVMVVMLSIIPGFKCHACTENELLLLINEKRQEAGLSPLNMDKELTKAAKIRAQEISTKFSHVRPDGTEYYTVSKDVYGENLATAKADHTAADIVNAWMNSPVHKSNVLYKDSTKTGFAVFEVNGITYIAEEFN